MGERKWAWIFLGLLAAAFVAYVAGLALLRRGGGRRGVVALAVAIQLTPLAAPLLLSSDAYTYWMYGDIARAGGDPYRDEPREYAHLPAYEWMGAAWHDRTSVYGPAFTLASEAVDGRSHTYAAWAYKVAAAAAMIAVVLLALRHSAFAGAFVGWNPVLAVHFAGGGHNDSWMIALVLEALALGAAGRRQAAGVAWALAIFVKWIPLILLPLRALEARATRRAVGHVGFAIASVLLILVATWQFGREWLDAILPLASNVELTSRYALPHRLSQLGVPESVAIGAFAVVFAAVYIGLAREAWRGRARLALAAGALVLCSPYVVVWYLGWVVPLAALEEDRTARVLALALTAYLLPQTIRV
ncbi:MAG TPA: glycosyltransferase 87 family protein [Gaiellaceae bacterium]|nr:glycosyltransferase 87 family protein [Gaiellaceae bacterium]